MKNYKKNIFLFLVTVFGGSYLAIGQVKIGGDPSVINVNSALEIEASDKGLLLPRVALVGTMSASPLTGTIVAGMTVYNTATTADVTPGFYYYNGAKWVRVADSASGSMIASSGLTSNGSAIRLGGALTSPTTITTDAANTFALSGLQTGLVTDDVLLSNGGVVKKIGAASFLNGATTVSNTSSANNLSTTVNGKVGIAVPIVNSNVLSVTGSNLTSTVNGVPSTPVDLTAAIVSGTTVSNTSSVNNLTITVNGKTGLAVPIINSNLLTNTNGNLVSTVNGVASSPGVPVLATSSNGLTTTNGDVKLGGALTGPTIVNTNATNTLALVGLEVGTNSDELITAKPDGVLRRTPMSALSSNIYNSNGSLSGDREVQQGDYFLRFNGTKGSVLIDNKNGPNINLYTFDSNGRSNISLGAGSDNLYTFLDGGNSANIRSSGVPKFTIGTYNSARIEFLTNNSPRIVVAETGQVGIGTESPNNTLEISSPTDDASGLRFSKLKSTSPESVGGAIGVDANGDVVRVSALTTSSNGLTTTNGNVKLGGTLTEATIVNTNATNTLALVGLEVGTGSDELITAKPDGVLRRTPMSALSSNIYNSNGSLSGNREVAQGDYHLRFNGTKGSVLIDNKNGSNLNLFTFDSNGRSNISLGAGTSNLYTLVDGGNSANISSYGVPMFTIGTGDAARVNFMTNNTQRISVTETGQVGIGTYWPNNTLEIFSPANDASGLRFSKLKSTSPESVGGAIGVDANGDVVRVSALTTSSNGLTTTSGDVKLGGALTGPTTITQGTNSLVFDGTAGTGGSTTFDNNSGSSVSILAKAANGNANLRLGTSSATLDSSINGGGAHIIANGSNGFDIGTNNASRLIFKTNNTERLFISDIGKVYIENTLVLYSSDGANDTSGLRFDKLRSSSPESIGAAIGVDGSGNVVRISSANSPFSNKVGSPVVIGATGTAPAKAAVAENDFIRYRELGNNQVEIDFLYSATGTGTADGTGDYLFTLPNGYSFNGGENPVYANPITTAAEVNSALSYVLRDVKTAFIGSAGVSTTAYVIPYDATRFRLVNISTNKAVGDTSNQLTNATVVYGGRFVFTKQ